MKTAVSLPDDLFKAAEGLAKRLRVSRSALYARALRRLLAEERGVRITQQLNAVYAKQRSMLDPVIKDLQARSLPQDDQW